MSFSNCDEHTGPGDRVSAFTDLVDLDQLPTGPLRPAPLPGVRPGEQDRDWRSDGYEREVLTSMQPDAPPTRLASRGEDRHAGRWLERQLGSLIDPRGTIAMMSCSGGVGKSTLSLALAGLLHAAGHGPVALVDCDAELAGLSLLSADGGAMTGVISAPDRDPTEHCTPLPSGIDLYATGHHPPVLELLQQRPEILRRIAQRLREIYPIVILDAGAGVQNAIGRTVAEICDVAVLVTRPTVASVAGLIYSYQYLRSSRALVDHEASAPTPTTVLAAINNVTIARQAFDLPLLAEELLCAGLDPVVIPADEAIEAAFDQGTHEIAALSAPARAALLQLATAAATPLADHVKRPSP